MCFHVKLQNVHICVVHVCLWAELCIKHFMFVWYCLRVCGGRLHAAPSTHLAVVQLAGESQAYTPWMNADLLTSIVSHWWDTDLVFTSSWVIIVSVATRSHVFWNATCSAEIRVCCLVVNIYITYSLVIIGCAASCMTEDSKYLTVTWKQQTHIQQVSRLRKRIGVCGNKLVCIQHRTQAVPIPQ